MKHSLSILCLWLSLALLLAGCGQPEQNATGTTPDSAALGAGSSAASTEESQLSNDGRALPLRCTLSEESHTFTPEDLGGNFDGDLYYRGLEVSITLDGREVPLEDAIREGSYTVEQLVADARVDARKQICTEETRTINGLTQFHYTYKDVFNIDVINDIYQTPDGQEHLYRKVTINKNGPSYNPNRDFTLAIVSEEDPTLHIDREDWGLTLEAEDITGSGLVLKTTQTGGQQVGSLELYDCWIFGNDTVVSWENGSFPLSPITMDGSGSIQLSWDDQVLAPGEYLIRLWIRDNYDPETIHPLIRKFHDWQAYQFYFTVPQGNSN